MQTFLKINLFPIFSEADNDAQSCCVQNNFKDRCHFLCDGSDSSVWDQFACAKERITLFTCKTQQSKLFPFHHYV